MNVTSGSEKKIFHTIGIIVFFILMFVAYILIGMAARSKETNNGAIWSLYVFGLLAFIASCIFMFLCKNDNKAIYKILADGLFALQLVLFLALLYAFNNATYKDLAKVLTADLDANEMTRRLTSSLESKMSGHNFFTFAIILAIIANITGVLSLC